MYRMYTCMICEKRTSPPYAIYVTGSVCSKTCDNIYLKRKLNGQGTRQASPPTSQPKRN